MSNQTLAVSWVTIGGHRLSITSRSVGDQPDVLEEITFRTIGAFLKLAVRIKAEAWELADNEHGSVESRYLAQMQAEHPDFVLAEAWGDARVTIWDKDGLDLHLNSDDDLQNALYTYKAHKLAIQRALELMPKTETAPAAQQQSDAPAAPPAAATGNVINATRAPNANRPEYAEGQLVAFQITKIVASSNQGSATFQMWSALGTQYPTITVYKQSKAGKLTSDYEKVKPVIEKIGFSFDKLEQAGNWRLITKATHADKEGKPREYLNVVSLEPMTA